MHPHSGCEEEYRKRHDGIWPKPKAELRASGVLDYTIYLDQKTGTLFAFQHPAGDAADGALAGREIVKKWRHLMKDLMDTNPDESPLCGGLVEMFHMD
jgi:L-rhamnose mutarotase